MYSGLQKWLFKIDAEKAHEWTMTALKMTQHNGLKRLYAQPLVSQPVECMGLKFANPLGLAAGLDKNAECIDGFAAMGFGFIEVGTVTPKPQFGNDKPRLFRIPEANAIINRMGFNNHGVDYLVEQVKRAQFNGVLGINIGKNKVTPEAKALDDYLICLEKVYAYASYVTVNISSPNTPGLRDLQYGEALDSLLSGLKQRQTELTDQHGRYVPVVVKIAPDLNTEEINSIADSLLRAKMDGVIATNTTLARDNVIGMEHAEEAGGLSGAPLTEKSLAVTRQLAERLQNALPIISVGGISNAEQARQRIEAGATLLQLYSGLIYQGAEIVPTILTGLQSTK